MVTLILTLALALYVSASAALALSFAGRVAAARWIPVLAGGGLVLHGAGIAAFTAVHGELPLVGLAPSLCTIAFLILVFMFVGSAAGESRPLGLVLVPLAAVLLGLALLIGVHPAGMAFAFSGVWFNLHVLFAFLGYAGLALAFAAGLLYLLQFRELKGKRLGRVYRFFPSLPVLDRLGRIGVGVGFPALTVALLLGWGWTLRFRQTLASENPEVIWGVITWFAFAVVFLLRRRAAPETSRTAAVASVAGFVVVVLAYVVLRTATVGRGFL